jgi:hypothetical protein
MTSRKKKKSCRLNCWPTGGGNGLGVLYNTVKQKQDEEAQVMINDLLALGITRARNGESIHDLNYYDLKQQLSVAKIRSRDIGGIKC